MIIRTGLKLPHNLWHWDKTGEDLEPAKWLLAAMKNLQYGNTKLWKQLYEYIDEADFKKFLELFRGIVD